MGEDVSNLREIERFYHTEIAEMPHDYRTALGVN
jgi:hypothetical protein